MGACLSDRTHTGWAGPSVGEREEEQRLGWGPWLLKRDGP